MNRLRVVLHAHSNWSYDGHWSLRGIARLYGALGVDVVMMSEHDDGFTPDRYAEYRAACALASTTRCRLVPGIEYSSPDNDIHILSWGLHDFFGEHQPVEQTLHQIQAGGGVSIFAHPRRRSAWKHFDPAWVPFLSGIELWNRKSDGVFWGARAWDLVQATGLAPTVGQDFHRLKQLYPLTMSFAPSEVEAAGDTNEALESHLVAELKEGAARPEVFRRPVLNMQGQPRQQPHRFLEAGRGGLVQVKNRLKGRKAR